MKPIHFLCRFIVISAALGGAVSSFAEAPDPAIASAQEFFGASKIYAFHLTIDADDFSSMQPGSGHQWFVPTASGSRKYIKVKAQLEFDGRDMGPISVRYKGNIRTISSRHELKRSMKLDFNDPNENKTFFGMKKLNLNSNATDSSQLREALGYDVFRQAGIPAARTAFAKVYLSVPGRYSRAYAGLYTVVEQVDQRFLKENFGKKSGLLLKPELLGDLPDLGDKWSAYGKYYREKVETDPAAAERFISFVRFLKESSDEEFAKNIGEYLDVREFLGFLAVEAVIVNLDSPLTLDHNYYLTINPTTNRIVWIPWDLNTAFGGFLHGSGTPLENLSVSKPYAPGKFKLAARVLSVPSLNEDYKRLVKEIVSKNFTEERMNGLLTTMGETIRAALKDDKYFDLENFENTFVENGAAILGAGKIFNPSPAANMPSQASAQLSRQSTKKTTARVRAAGMALFSKGFFPKRRTCILEQLEGKRQGWTPNAGLSNVSNERPNQNQPSEVPKMKATEE
jgi:spore coat protein H